jgi:adenylate kinase
VLLVLQGLPGAGKGTQGALLAEHYRVPHVATGDIIRDHIARGTEFGRKVQAAIAGGNFAPDSDILYWVYRRLAGPDAASGYILDGFPRDLPQANELDDHLRRTGEHLDAVIELVIDEAVLIERLSGRLVCPKCGESYHVVSRPSLVTGFCDRDGEKLVRRPDDEPAAIKRRFEIYHNVTEPLSAYYSSAGLFVPVDGDGAPDEVFNRALVAIEGRKSAPAG